MVDQPATSNDKTIDVSPKENWSKFQQTVAEIYQNDLKADPTGATWDKDRAAANKKLDDTHVLPNLEITGVDTKTGNLVLKSEHDYANGKMSFEIDNKGKVVDVIDQAGNEWKNQNGVWSEYDKNGNAVVGSDGKPVTSISQVGFDKEGNFLISNPNTHTLEIYGADGSIKVVDASTQQPGFTGTSTLGVGDVPQKWAAAVNPENPTFGGQVTSTHQNGDGSWTVVQPGGPAVTYNAQGQAIGIGNDR